MLGIAWESKKRKEKDFDVEEKESLKGGGQAFIPF